MNWYIKFSAKNKSNVGDELANDLGLSRSKYTGEYENEKQENAVYNNDIYHMDMYDSYDSNIPKSKNWIWWWDRGVLKISQELSHGMAWGHEVIGKNYKGRYSPNLNTITIALPYNNPHPLSEDELIQQDENAIPVINALHKKWPNVRRIVGI